MESFSSLFLEKDTTKHSSPEVSIKIYASKTWRENTQ